jgi:hypothetical protein
LADALQALLDDHLTALREEAKKKGTAAVLPDRLQVTLVIESDAPCQVKLNSLAVHYHLTRQTLCAQEGAAPSGEKIRLRFPGGKTVTRRVYVSLHPGALVEAVSLRVAAAFGANPAAAVNGSDGQHPLGDTAHGIALAAEHRAAVQVTPGNSLTATGLGLPLLVHTAGTDFRVEFQEHWNGSPSGKALAAGRVLLLPPAAERSGRLPSALTGIQPGHRFFAPAFDMTPKTSPFNLVLNGAAVVASTVAEDTFTFADGALEDFLNAQLAGSAAHDPLEAYPISLFFTSALAGGITVYPIEIRYAWLGL